MITENFSKFRAVLLKRFKPLAYNRVDPDWYIDLYQGPGTYVDARCISKGGNISNKVVGIARKTSIDMRYYLLRQQIICARL